MIRAFAQARKGAPGFECGLLYRVFTVLCVLQHSKGKALGGRDQRRHQVGERPVLIGLDQRVQRHDSRPFNAPATHFVALSPQLRFRCSSGDALCESASCKSGQLVDPRGFEPLTS